MKKINSIKRKILVSVLGMAIVSLSVFCAVALGGLFGIRSQMQDSSERLGEFAAGNSSRFLEREAVDKLMTKADARARIIHERLQIIAKDVAFFADYASKLYKNADSRPPVPIPYTSSKNHGKLTMQLKSAGGKADYPRIKKEAELLGNLTSAYMSNSDDMDVMTVAVFIGTESGIMVVFDPFSSDTAEFDPRARPWYVGAKERGGAFWTVPYHDASSGKVVVTCAYPVYGAGGKFVGVTGIDVVIGDLNDEIINRDVGEHGYAIVVDGEGILISSKELAKQEGGAYQKKSAYRDGYPEYNSVIKKMTKGETGFEKVVTDKGEKYIAYSPIPATGWSVAIVQPVSEIMGLVTENNAAIDKMTDDTLDYINATIKVIFIIFVVVFAMSIIAVVYFADVMSYKITRPIVTLEECLDRIADGELDTRMELKTGDEIERLGNSVNTMAHELKEYIGNLQKITADKERIGTELNVATNIQAAMLPRVDPPPFPDRSEFDIYASMQPAKEVGGDFYDFFLIDENTLAVVIADVSGKGVPAALFMAITKTLIKNNAQAGRSPGEVFWSVNNMLCENNDNGMFVTAFMGYLDINSGKFTYVNAGHNPPVLRSYGECNFLKVKPGFILAGFENTRFSQDEISLQRGDELFLYTDGVTEATDSQKTMFGDARLIESLYNYVDMPLQETVISIKGDIDKFAKGAEQADDITMLALRYVGAGEESPRDDCAKETVRVSEELSVEAKTENLNAVMDFVTRKLEAAGCLLQLQNQIAIAVEEIFVNIAHYAYSPDAGDVKVRVSINDEIALEFEDSGKPYNPLEKEDPDITKSVQDREVGGLGIFMVKKLMDSVDYRREGDRNVLTLTKKV
uniref:Serine phosphatase RsbU n=1 Tax=uncultured bacterium contig00093 TaxID=1181564 RepID=A0A806KEZ2_9BACT|nr:serine phosphatase RsbU [uncultured bacterium contig00093]